ncbi:MAG: HD domain-containing protein [Gammaproteobacteria bacterium]|jgi:predicted HD phosphohydrolase|nr:HD domain-containing protein [Gammaproteobacteria bacterium]MBT5202221.1 HD domain-containing protein [Gammaproteobacteria bacterium]MBT5602168.1 HD domain-containing protein [Gammaproteobacteria bacterium]MBT6246131.1 HD domain-containing protein [Gammaproteobacteria bacterium]
MNTVSFSSMSEGSKADYLLLAEYERDQIDALPDTILYQLRSLETGLQGYKIHRLEHALQAATRAERDGMDKEWIIAALVHDIGDSIAPLNHSQLAAAVIRPYVRAEVTWVVEMHGLFQMIYYADHLDLDPNGRDQYKDHRWYDSCIRFCERLDEPSFDPEYDSASLDHFTPLVRDIFSRPAFDPAIIDPK